MSDHPIPPDWDPLWGPPPSPQELEEAEALAGHLEGEPLSAEALDAGLDGLLSMVHLVQHSAHPPVLDASRKADIEAELLGAWEASSQEQAAKQTAQAEPWWRSWWGLLSARPALVWAGAACLAILALVSTLQPSPKESNRPTVAMNAGPQHSNATLPKAPLRLLSSSPWAPGQNPFDKTRNPSQRLQRVVDHLSHQDQESSLEEIGSNYLMHSRL